MTETTDPGAGPETPQPVAAPAEVTVGTQLREARERLGLSVSEVAQRLKFAARQIEALEADQASALPGLTFVRGFVRSYAKLVGLEPDPLVSALERKAVLEAHDSGPNTLQLQRVTATPQRFPVRSSSSSGWPWVVAIVVAVVGLGGFTLYQWQAPDSIIHPPQSAAPAAPAAPAMPVAPPAEPPVVVPAAPAPAAPSVAAPAIAPPVVPAAAPVAPPAKAEPAAKDESSGSGKIRLVFSEESWTEIRQGNGKVLLYGQKAAGTDIWVDGTPPFDFVIGNAPAVKLFYRGSQVDLTPYTKVSVARMQLR